jgi:uncharacterized protein YcaQ
MGIRAASDPAPPIVPVGDARKLLLAGCALDRAPRRATRASVLTTVTRLGFVQVDSINSVERAHHLILHARLDGFSPVQLSHHTESTRRLFEHWTHDASIIRSDWLPWWVHRFERSRARRGQSAWMRARLGPRWRRVIDEVRAAIAGRGALTTRDFPRPPRAGEGWWDWSPHKAALEHLWRSGEVAIAGRRGFDKVYDLAERVHGPLPAAPTRGALVAWGCREALDRLGAATTREIAHHLHAIEPREAADWCAAAARRGEIATVRLERRGRDPRPGYARLDWRRAARAVEPDAAPRLLAPFDPLIRDRARLLELFDFAYRFEAFVPAAKRRHGYYTMPVLVGDRLVARLDLATDRSAGTLRVDRCWTEDGTSARAGRSAARESAERLAEQLGHRLDFRAR